MKIFRTVCLYVLLAAVVSAKDFKVEFGPMPEWQRPILAKVSFGVQVRSLSEIAQIDTDDVTRPSFLVFTARTKENLDARLLAINGEVELSDGRIEKFKGVSFYLLANGVEADVRKLDGVDSPRQGDLADNADAAQEPLRVVKLRILGAVLK